MKTHSSYRQILLALMSAVIILCSIVAESATAQIARKRIPEQAAPVYRFVKAVYANDLTGFTNSFTASVREAYVKEDGSIVKSFARIKTALPAEFKDVKLSDFTFLVTKKERAGITNDSEYDGEYYMVMLVATNVNSAGFLVKTNDKGAWKITTPRYKNLDQILKDYKKVKDKTSKKTSFKK
jgi:hypothetical protein